MLWKVVKKLPKAVKSWQKLQEIDKSWSVQCITISALMPVDIGGQMLSENTLLVFWSKPSKKWWGGSVDSGSHKLSEAIFFVKWSKVWNIWQKIGCYWCLKIELLSCTKGHAITWNSSVYLGPVVMFLRFPPKKIWGSDWSRK